MPGHTPEEKAKNAAARSIQPGPDRQGGSAAVSDDAGSQSTIQKWREYLRRPEVQVGLLQFGAQMLQTNPGGFAPAFGTSLISGLSAVGRFSKLEREQGLERTASAAETRQQQIENQLDERRVTEIEKRTSILGRPKVGKKVPTADDELREEWGAFVDSEFEFQEGTLDPTTKTARVNAAMQAVKEQVMQAALAQGVTPTQVIDDYVGGNREKLRAALGFNVAAGTENPDPDAVGGDELTPEVPEFKTTGSKGGTETSEVQIQRKIAAAEAELLALREKGLVVRSRGGKKEAQKVLNRKVDELVTRIADLKSRLGE